MGVVSQRTLVVFHFKEYKDQRVLNSKYSPFWEILNWHYKCDVIIDFTIRVHLADSGNTIKFAMFFSLENKNEKTVFRR